MSASDPEIQIDKSLSPKVDANTTFIQIDKRSTPEIEARTTFSDLDIEKKRIRNRHLIEDQKERKRYATFAFIITCIWICFLMAIALLQLIYLDGLTQTEFVAVMTTTTASIFANWYLVGKYLFNKQLSFKKNKELK